MIRRTLGASKAATFCVELPHPSSGGLPAPTGTGFFVSPDGWFVTAGHVVREGGRPEGQVRTDISKAWLKKELPRPGTTSPFCDSVSLEYADPRHDIALLKVDLEANVNKDWLKGKTGFPHLRVSSRNLEEGEPVYCFGYPLSDLLIHQKEPVVVGETALCPRVTSAIVSSTIEMRTGLTTEFDEQVYVVDKALNYGNSGGPVIAAETGNVHALCTRFQPVFIPQQHLASSEDPDEQVFVAIPSLYGVVLSLANPMILDLLGSHGINHVDQ